MPEPDFAAEVNILLSGLPRVKITPDTIDQHLIDQWYARERKYGEEIAALKEQLAAGPAELDVETLARTLSAADGFVNNGDYPTWGDLSKAQGVGQDDYRKMARFLLRRLAITARDPKALHDLLDGHSCPDPD